MRETLPLILCTVLYAWQAALLFRRGQHGFGLAFAGYCLANLGLIHAVLRP